MVNCEKVDAMDAFEQQLARLTDEKDCRILGALAFVVDSRSKQSINTPFAALTPSENVIYSHASGHQSLSPGSPPLDPKSPVSLMSAGKFVTHLACLQLVENGLATLDEPIHRLLPEFKDISVIQPPAAADGPGYDLVPAKRDVTLRHMLSNSSGITSDGNPLVDKWRDVAQPRFPSDTSPIIQRLFAPLIFHPGEGWCYGHDVHFLQVVIERATGQRFQDYIQEHVFQVLGMDRSTYVPQKVPAVIDSMLPYVERGQDGKLVSVDRGQVYGLTCGIPDLQALFADLISPEPKLLKQDKKMLDLVFSSGLEGPALSAFRAEAKDFAAAPANVSDSTASAVSYSPAGAMYVEQDGLQSPRGSLCWDGMHNVAFAVNRDKGLAMFFGTQLLPEYDDVTLRLMKVFFRDAWAAFA